MTLNHLFLYFLCTLGLILKIAQSASSPATWVTDPRFVSGNFFITYELLHTTPSQMGYLLTQWSSPMPLPCLEPRAWSPLDSLILSSSFRPQTSISLRYLQVRQIGVFKLTYGQMWGQTSQT